MLLSPLRSRTLCALIALGWLQVSLPGPATGAPQTCTSQSDFSWPSVGDTASTDWDCLDADSPGPDDHFLIAHQVTVTGDIEQDGFAASAGITVAGGGTLLATTPVTLSLGRDGLDCESGSVCRLTGGYRQLDANPALLATPDPLASFSVGDVVPCADVSGNSDCDDPTLRDRVRFEYPAARYPEAADLCASLAAVDDGGGAGRGDVLAFWNPDPSDLHEGTDTYFWYEIMGVAAQEPCHIDFSVHQGTQDQDGYPLARRELATYLPSRDVVAGDRDIELHAGTLAAPDYHDGRMLRFESGGAPGATTYRIYDSVSGATDDCADGVGPCDLLRLADHRGVADGISIANPDEDRVWVDYGWEPGDPYRLVAPVRVEAAPGALGQALVTLHGTVELRGVVFYRTDRVRWRVEATDGCRDLWLEDQHTGSAGKLELDRGIDCEGVSITGGDPVAALDISHTIGAETSEDVILRALALRHAGDDYFSVKTGFTPEVTFDRFRAQFKSTNAPSDECIATGNSPVRLTANDVECIDAVNTGSNFGPQTTPGSSFVVNSAAVIASRGGFWGSTFGDTLSSFTDVTIIGSDIQQPNGEIMPMNVDRFVVRDSVHRQGRLLLNSVSYARNGIVKDNRIDVSLGITVSDITLENIAFIRTRSPGSVDLVNANFQPSTAAIWRNVLVVANAGDPGFRRIWRFGVNPTDLSRFTLGGLAFVDHTGPSADRVLHNQTGIALDDPVLGPVFEAPLCFFNNDFDASPDLLAELPAGTLHGVDPEFVDAASDRYDSVAGSPWDLTGCSVLRGPAAPGVHAFQRYHAWSNLVPEGMADACNNGADDDFDGAIDFPGDVGCRDEESQTESPQCQDGVDNDGDGKLDWDGAGQGDPDPHCLTSFDNSERPPARCGLTPAAAIFGAALARIGARRRWRSAKGASAATAASTST